MLFSAESAWACLCLLQVTEIAEAGVGIAVTHRLLVHIALRSGQVVLHRHITAGAPVMGPHPVGTVPRHEIVGIGTVFILRRLLPLRHPALIFGLIVLEKALQIGIGATRDERIGVIQRRRAPGIATGRKTSVPHPIHPLLDTGRDGRRQQMVHPRRRKRTGIVKTRT